MAASPLPKTSHEPPATGRAGDFRARSVHPDVTSNRDADPVTLRLILLIRSNPGVSNYRVEDLVHLDSATKSALIEQVEAALGLNAPTPSVL